MTISENRMLMLREQSRTKIDVKHSIENLVVHDYFFCSTERLLNRARKVRRQVTYSAAGVAASVVVMKITL